MLEKFNPEKQYMTFHPDEIELIEKKVLVNYVFNKEQVSFIHFLESGIIEAAPGARGKLQLLEQKLHYLSNVYNKGGIRGFV